MLIDHMAELEELTREDSKLNQAAKLRSLAEYEFFVKDQLQKCVKATLIESYLVQGMPYNKAENAALADQDYKTFIMELADKKFELQEAVREHHALLNRRDALSTLLSS